MVKARQKNFRAFVFTQGNAQETITYIEKNFILLKDFLMVFTYPIKTTSDSNSLYNYLLSKSLNFIELLETKNGESCGQLQLEVSTTHSLPSNIAKNNGADSTLKPTEAKNTQIKPTLVFHRTIRSGEEIIAQGDLTIFGRINSGAHIQSEGNIQIFGSINGNIFCNGDYMILGKVGEGNVLFGGEILDKELLQYTQNKIYRKQQKVIIEELK